MTILIEYNRNLELVKSSNIHLYFFWITPSFLESYHVFFLKRYWQEFIVFHVCVWRINLPLFLAAVWRTVQMDSVLTTK